MTQEHSSTLVGKKSVNLSRRKKRSRDDEVEPTSQNSSKHRKNNAKKMPQDKLHEVDGEENSVLVEDDSMTGIIVSNDTPQPMSWSYASQAGSRNLVDVDEILTGTYLSKRQNKGSLDQRLKDTWSALQQVSYKSEMISSNNPIIDCLPNVCNELLDEKFLGHSDEVIRSLTACCFAELLRIYYPESPFTSVESLYDAFQCIFEQLQNLSAPISKKSHQDDTSVLSVQALSILESLALVKSPLLLVGVRFTVEENEDILIVQLFDTMFKLSQSYYTPHVESLMLSIMTSCLQKIDIVEPRLFDVILLPLVHNREDIVENNLNDQNGSPYRLSQGLVRQNKDFLLHHISKLVNSMLLESSTISYSELADHPYTLIYELHKIHPSLILYILPNVCMQLQVDDVPTRSKVISCLGNLFASSTADIGTQFPKNFRDFCQRFRDKELSIRIQMVKSGSQIWRSKPSLAKIIETELMARLNDPEWSVRRQAVNEICDFAANDLESVSLDCLRAVGERMKDKNIIIRKETMTGLSQIYSIHISSFWHVDEEFEDDDKENEDYSAIGHPPSSHIRKLAWIPDYVLKCYAYPQEELKLRVIQLLDDILLPKSLGEGLRAHGLLFMYAHFDGTSKEALKRILKERSQCQRLWQKFFVHYARLIKSKQSTKVQATKVFEQEFRVLCEGLRIFFPQTALEFDKFGQELKVVKDRSTLANIKIVIDPLQSQVDIRSARDALIKSVGSKSVLGNVFKLICRKISAVTVSCETISQVFQVLQSKSSNARTCVDFIKLVSETCPQLISPFIQSDFSELLIKAHSENNDIKLILAELQTLYNYAKFWHQKRTEQEDVTLALEKENSSERPSNVLMKLLGKLCIQSIRGSKQTETDESIAKCSSFILSVFSVDEDNRPTKSIHTILETLTTKARLLDKSSTCLITLQSLCVLVKQCSTAVPDEMLLRLWKELTAEITPNEKNVNNTKKSPLPTSKLVGRRCLMLKVLTNILLYISRPCLNNSQCQDFLKILFNVLRSDGKTWISNASHAATYRSTAACSILKLLRNRSIEGMVSIPQWHILGYVMHDASDIVRQNFIKKLSAHLMKQTVPHPHKYLSYLALAATEPDANLKKQAKNLLSHAVERMRMIFEASTSLKQVNRRSLNNEDFRSFSSVEDEQAKHALMVPEYALPYVIHLLAHHPDCPDGRNKSAARVHVSEDSQWSDQRAYLNFFFDVLVSSKSGEGDNISFLLQILTKISTCVDITHGDTSTLDDRTSGLIDCAVTLLQQKIKTQSNLKPFPGKIYLPKHLYALQLTDEERENNNVHAQSGKISLSPIRRTDGNFHMDMRGKRISNSPNPTLPSPIGKGPHSLGI